jgi:hypothetical protein
MKISQCLYLAGLAIGSAACALACSGEGNSGRSEIGDALAEMVPWVKGRAPVLDETGNVVMPSEPVYPAIATGKSDSGSGDYDCSALDGLEFSTEHWYESFEADERYSSALGPAVGAAQAWSSYDDSSDGVFRVPGEIGIYEGLRSRHGATWGLPAEKVEGAPRCGDEANDWVLHFRGGRFNRFGGGMGHPLAEVCVEDPDHELCPSAPEEGAEVDAAGFPLTAPGGSAYDPPVHNYWDVSQYDGISFWARRGPESEGAIGVVIFDKYSSEDLNRQNETYCRRLKSCRTACVNREPCTDTGEETAGGVAIHRCYNPETTDLRTIEPVLLEEVFPRCGVAACTHVATYADPEFEGKSCRPYTFQTHETGEYCYDEGDPPPPESSERCGDGYGLQVNLNSNWQFIKVPFSEMRQFGHGKVSPSLDLTTASGIAIVTAKGWIDIYIDNVSFYKEAE